MADTRDRIMSAGTELFRRNGYTGTGLKQISTAADAPFGSIYHFFPGGKQQLADEAIRSSGALYERLFDVFLGPAPDLLTGLATMFEGAARTLVETGYADACPIATVALEVAGTNETLRRATADVFDGWINSGIGHFTRWGIGASDARALTITLITSLEGAFVLSRAQRDTEAVTIAGSTVRAAARAALDRAETP